MLKVTIETIMTKQAPGTYTLQVCMVKLSVAYPESFDRKLYDETKVLLEAHAASIFDDLKICQEDILGVYYGHWYAYKHGLYNLAQFLKHLKFTYYNKKASKGEPIVEIEELVLDTWSRVINEPLKQSLSKSLINYILADQCGDTEFPSGVLPVANVLKPFTHSHKYVGDVLESFTHLHKYKKSDLELQQYQEIFEIPFLKKLSYSFQQDAQTLTIADIISYCSEVIRLWDVEKCRFDVLHPSSHSKVQVLFYQHIIKEKIPTLFSFCKYMMKTKQWKDLSLLYRLLRLGENGIPAIVQIFEDYMKKNMLPDTSKGHEISGSSNFLKTLVKQHMEYYDIIRTTFWSNPQFLKALDRVSAPAVNFVTRAAEQLAEYSDTLLKKNSTAIKATELAKNLVRCIHLSTYLDDGDMYIESYSKYMSRRLLSGTFFSINTEKMMISQLTNFNPVRDTRNLVQMLKDMTVSEQLTKEFQDTHIFKDTSMEKFSVKILRTSSWPVEQTIQTYTFPLGLGLPIQMFENFYNQKFKGRKLSWLHGLCNAEVELNYLKKQYVVNFGSTFQLALILQFNEHVKIRKEELGATMQLPEAELTKHMQSLVDANLIIESTVDNNVYVLNMDFMSKHSKLRVLSAQKTTQNGDMTEKHVADQRRNYIQACIVRIMKSQKVLQHKPLIQEVISQCSARFCPGIDMIKKCIEELISKGYIERVKGSLDQYSYIA